MIPPSTFNDCPVTKWLSSDQKCNWTCNVFCGPNPSKRRLVLQVSADRRNLEVTPLHIRRNSPGADTVDSDPEQPNFLRENPAKPHDGGF